MRSDKPLGPRAIASAVLPTGGSLFVPGTGPTFRAPHRQGGLAGTESGIIADRGALLGPVEETASDRLRPPLTATGPWWILSIENVTGRAPGTAPKRLPLEPSSSLYISIATEEELA